MRWPSLRFVLVCTVFAFTLSIHAQTNCSLRMINFGNYPYTNPLGVNVDDTVVGNYLTNTQDGMVWKGFRWYNGTPIATSTVYSYTGINDHGDVIGTHGKDGFLHAGGHVYRIHYPGAEYTNPVAINNNGVILGIFYSSGNFSGNFYRDDKGYHRLPTIPGAQQTIFNGLNDAGVMVGYFYGANGAQHGFAYNKGKFVQIDYPNATATTVQGINNAGAIVGTFYKNSGGYGTAFTLSGHTFKPYQVRGAFETGFNAISNTGHWVGYAIFGETTTRSGFIRRCK